MPRIYGQPSQAPYSIPKVESTAFKGFLPVALGPARQFRQLRDFSPRSAAFIFAEQLSRRSSPRFILEIDIGKLLSVVVADDKNQNRRWIKAGGNHQG
jgi:hypothetical protein